MSTPAPNDPAVDLPAEALGTVAPMRWGVWASYLGLLPREEAAGQARALEDLGYASIWVGEAEGKEVIAHATLLLDATESVDVATGIANIFARDAQAMRNASRTLAEWHPGRFTLGIGASHAPLVELRGQVYDRPFTAMQRYLDALEEVPWRGPDVGEEPPVVLAALGPKMLELAGTRADGAHTFLVTPQHTAQARTILGDGKLLVPEQAFVLADTREEARRSGDRHLRNYLRLPNYQRNLERLGFDDPRPDDDRVFDAIIAWGDVDRVAARIREHADAGADEVALHPLMPSADVSPLPQLQALGEELLVRS